MADTSAPVVPATARQTSTNNASRPAPNNAAAGARPAQRDAVSDALHGIVEGAEQIQHTQRGDEDPEGAERHAEAKLRRERHQQEGRQHAREERHEATPAQRIAGGHDALVVELGRRRAGGVLRQSVARGLGGARVRRLRITLRVSGIGLGFGRLAHRRCAGPGTVGDRASA
jgi:hypothetical protein